MKKNDLTISSIGSGLVFLLITVVFLSSGCGKKGDPLPPLAPAVPAARNLEAEAGSEAVVLSWELESRDSSALAGFTIQRSRIDPKADDCPGCPIVFRRVADLAASQTRWEGSRAVYIDRPEAGYRYIYKITPYGPGGTGGSCETQTAVLEIGK